MFQWSSLKLQIIKFFLHCCFQKKFCNSFFPSINSCCNFSSFFAGYTQHQICVFCRASVSSQTLAESRQIAAFGIQQPYMSSLFSKKKFCNSFFPSINSCCNFSSFFAGYTQHQICVFCRASVSSQTLAESRQIAAFGIQQPYMSSLFFYYCLALHGFRQNAKTTLTSHSVSSF